MSERTENCSCVCGVPAVHGGRIIVFDGVCVLCSRWVHFVLRRDPAGRYKFAAMQTPRGRELLTQHGLDPDNPISFLLLEGGRGYADTDAIVRVLQGLNGLTRLLAGPLRLTPHFIRDPLYRFVARHRYRLFGRRDACLAPTPDLAERFLR
jgi:predicted DCC family thiol-disulfide oxidoreductase YuxK